MVREGRGRCSEGARAARRARDDGELPTTFASQVPLSRMTQSHRLALLLDWELFIVARRWRRTREMKEPRATFCVRVCRAPLRVCGATRHTYLVRF